MIERIVVGVDPSNVAREVLRNAAAVAARLDAKLVLVGTVPTTEREGASHSDEATDASADASAAPRGEGNDAPPALLALLARKALEACAEDLPAERVERTEVRSGPAWQALCHAAE